MIANTLLCNKIYCSKNIKPDHVHYCKLRNMYDTVKVGSMNYLTHQRVPTGWYQWLFECLTSKKSNLLISP